MNIRYLKLEQPVRFVMPFLLFARQKFHRDPFTMNSMDVEMFNDGARETLVETLSTRTGDGDGDGTSA